MKVFAASFEFVNKSGKHYGTTQWYYSQEKVLRLIADFLKTNQAYFVGNIKWHEDIESNHMIRVSNVSK